MIIRRLLKKNYFSLFFCVTAAVVLFSCASAPKENTVIGKTASAEYAPSNEEEEITSISGSHSKDRAPTSYFSAIPESIMKDVEFGSSASVRKAAATVRRTEIESQDSQKLLLSVCHAIMEMVWSSARIDWENPTISFDNRYSGAIRFAKNGIYDTSTGSSDFLSLVLPSLAVQKVNDVSPFFADSEKSLKAALALRPDSVLAQYLLGTLYKKYGRESSALACFKAAYDADSSGAEVVASYAEALYADGNTNRAFTVVSSAVEKNPTDAALLRLCAKTSFELGKLDSAEEYISRVLQTDPNDLDSVLFRAKILMEKKDYIHAASLLDMYSRQDSTSKNYLLLRAQIQADWSKNNTAAVSTIENALRRYPDDKDVLLFAAKLSGSANVPIAGKYAEDYASLVLSVDPNNETALLYAVEGLVSKKEWSKAYSASSSLVASRSAKKETVFNHVKICLALKKYDEAWNLIQPLYRANSSDEEVVQNYILVMVASGRSKEASTLINQLLGSAGAKLKSFLYYERSFLQQTEESRLSDLRSSLIANPRNSDSLFRLYEIYFAKRDYRKAQYYLKQVAALNPSDQEIRRLNEQLTSLLQQ